MLWLAGGLHDDPLARINLRSWLSHLSYRYKRAPLFVAAEWDEDQYNATAAQRPYLRGLLRNEWGDAADSFLVDLCSRSIAYEADTHRDDLFDEHETDTVYLDYKRGDAHALVANAAFPIFRDRLKDRALASNAHHALCRLQEQAYCWADTADPGDRDTTRDVYFTIRLIDRLTTVPFDPHGDWAGDWAVAIVGAAHATRCDKMTFASLLDEAGQPYAVRYLGWVPPASHHPILA